MRRLTRLSIVRGGVAVIILLVAGAACSTEPSLSAEQRAEAETIVDQRVETARIVLSGDDRTCTVDQLTPSDLDGLTATDPVLEPLATAVVDCVGTELIGASVLRPQAAEVDPASLECAVAELDRTFVIDLVEGAMAEQPPRVRAEIEVARALGVCLGLDELIDQ